MPLILKLTTRQKEVEILKAKMIIAHFALLIYSI